MEARKLLLLGDGGWSSEAGGGEMEDRMSAMVGCFLTAGGVGAVMETMGDRGLVGVVRGRFSLDVGSGAEGGGRGDRSERVSFERERFGFSSG